jgi:hypothetical protein
MMPKREKTNSRKTETFNRPIIDFRRAFTYFLMLGTEIEPFSGLKALKVRIVLKFFERVD